MAYQHTLGQHGCIDGAVHALAQLLSRIMFMIEDGRERSVLRHEPGISSAQGELGRPLAEPDPVRSHASRPLLGHPGAARRLPAMARRIGVDVTTLPTTSTMRDLEWHCMGCRSWGLCRIWLASDTEGDGYRTFCPNAETLEQIRDQQELSRRKQDCAPSARPSPPSALRNEH